MTIRGTPRRGNTAIGLDADVAVVVPRIALCFMRATCFLKAKTICYELLNWLKRGSLG